MLHDLGQRLIVGHAGGVGRVLLRILVGRVGSNLGRDVVSDALCDSVGVGEERAEVLVERLEDVAQAVELRLRLVAVSIRRYRLNLRVLVLQGDLHRRLLLNTVAIHVDGVEDALGEVLLLRCRQLGDQHVEQDRELLPFGVAVGNYQRKEAIGSAEHLGLALEAHLAVLVEPVHVDRHTGIEDRVELVAVGITEEQCHHLIHLLRIERRPQVVQLVGVGLLGEQRRAVVVLEGESEGAALEMEPVNSRRRAQFCRDWYEKKVCYTLLVAEGFAGFPGDCSPSGGPS